MQTPFQQESWRINAPLFFPANNSEWYTIPTLPERVPAVLSAVGQTITSEHVIILALSFHLTFPNCIPSLCKNFPE